MVCSADPTDSPVPNTTLHLTRRHKCTHQVACDISAPAAAWRIQRGWMFPNGIDWRMPSSSQFRRVTRGYHAFGVTSLSLFVACFFFKKEHFVFYRDAAAGTAQSGLCRDTAGWRRAAVNPATTRRWFVVRSLMVGSHELSHATLLWKNDP